MAIDPNKLPRIGKSAPKHERFTLEIHHLAPEDIEPNGDRYCIEVIDFDEQIELGQLLVIIQDPTIDPRDPKANPNVEKRGVIGGIIITGGDGHLLGLPDWAVVTGRETEEAVINDVVGRVPANVPMKYAYGDVVFVDANMKGRALRIHGRELRLINNIDILARITNIRLMYVDGKWTEVKH